MDRADLLLHVLAQRERDTRRLRSLSVWEAALWPPRGVGSQQQSCTDHGEAGGPSRSRTRPAALRHPAVVFLASPQRPPPPVVLRLCQSLSETCRLHPRWPVPPCIRPLAPVAARPRGTRRLAKERDFTGSHPMRTNSDLMVSQGPCVSAGASFWGGGRFTPQLSPVGLEHGASVLAAPVTGPSRTLCTSKQSLASRLGVLRPGLGAEECAVLPPPGRRPESGGVQRALGSLWACPLSPWLTGHPWALVTQDRLSVGGPCPAGLGQAHYRPECVAA